MLFKKIYFHKILHNFRSFEQNSEKCKMQKVCKISKKIVVFFWKSFFCCKPYRSCFKKFVFFKWLCLKWSFFIKIIVSLTILNDNHSITIVCDDHLLKIVSDDHSLMIVNDVPLLTIVKYEPSLTIVKDSPVNDR